MRKIFGLSVALVLTFFNGQLLSAQVITTFAGGFGGGSATSAELNSPLGISFDNTGNLYIADGGNNIIRRIDVLSGVATIVAGSGCYDYFGDGGTALTSGIYLPSALAIDAAGNIYIADNEHSTIRKVDIYGYISSIAGNDINGFAGDNGPASSAQLNVSTGVAADDSGNIYIADENNNRIRKISSSGIITTFAGNGAAGYSGDGNAATAARLHGPVGVALDGAGNVYVADMYNSAIRKITKAGIITTIAGNGTAGYSGDGMAATAAQLFFPTSVYADPGGNIFVCDCQNNAVRRIDAAGIITTFAGNTARGFSGDGGPATAAALNIPYGITGRAGNIYIADQGNNRIRVVNSAVIINTVAGPGYFSGDGGPALAATLYRPQGVAGDRQGNFYIADTYNRRIRKVDATGIMSTIAGTGAAGNTGDGGPATGAAFYLPMAITVDAAGNKYVLDTDNTIRKIDVSGRISRYAGTGVAGYNGDGIAAISAQLNHPGGIAADSLGNLFISDNNNHRIRKVDTSGRINTYAGTGAPGYSGNGGAATAAEINTPVGVAVDEHGNVYIADYFNYVIRMVNPAGNIATFAGSGTAGISGYGGPATAADLIVTGVAVDRAGDVFILNNSDDYVIEVDSTGVIYPIAGRGSEDYGLCGENGIDSLADLSNPMAVATDNAGNIYIADEFNNRIRVIYPAVQAAVPIVSAASGNCLVSPNPAANSVTVKLPATISAGAITLSNAMGQIVASAHIVIGTSEYTLSLNHISSGSYFILVSSGDIVFRQKLVVIK